MPTPHSSKLARWIPALAMVLVVSLPSPSSAGDRPLEEAPDLDATGQTLDRLAADPAPQSRKLWVYFRDKGFRTVTEYESRRLGLALTLDDHSRARRARTMAAPHVDFLDLPVHEDYVRDLIRRGLRVESRSRWLNAVSATADPEVWSAVAELPFVQRLEFVALGRPSEVLRTGPDGRTLPDGPGRAGRGGLDYGPSFDQLDEINIVGAHALGWTGAGVRVAMLDTGYYQDHDAFIVPIANGQLVAQYDFVNDDTETQDEAEDIPGQHLHGTLTWSIVGGFSDGELIGAAYGADFLLAKTESASIEDPIEEDFWVAGMEWADSNGADVISSSLGYYDWYTYEDLDGETAVSTLGATVAASRGIVVCTAMGNEGTQDWYFMIAPADADGILSVGGTNPDGTMWVDSSHGPTFDGRTKPEVVARGSETWGAASPEDHNGEGYRGFGGTSVATPLVAGAAAILLEANPSWTPATVREALMSTADNAGTPDNHRGWGRIDVTSALGFTPSGLPTDAPAVVPALVFFPNPVRSGSDVRVFRSGGFGNGGGSTVELFAADGRRLRSLMLPSGEGSWTLTSADDGGRALIPGMYLVRVTPAGGTPFAGKLVVR